MEEKNVPKRMSMLELLISSILYSLCLKMSLWKKAGEMKRYFIVPEISFPHYTTINRASF